MTSLEAVTPPLVSVVVPTHDRLDLLKETVASVLAQTFSESEVVVVDDASSDGTREWLKSQEGERLTAVILEEHRERSAARNRGLEMSRGEFVLFLDDDDLLRPLALERLYPAVAGDPEAIAAVGGSAYFRDSDARTVTDWRPRRTLKRAIWAEVLALWNMPQQGILWRSEVVRSIGGWNERVFDLQEDWELLIRASKQGPMVFVPEHVVDIRLYDAGARTSPLTREQTFQAERVWLQEYVDSLPRRDRATAERLIEARWLWRAGRDEYAAFESRKALVLFLQAVRRSPERLRSPLVGPRALREMLQAFVGMLVGRGALSAARRVKDRVQGLRRR